MTEVSTSAGAPSTRISETAPSACWQSAMLGNGVGTGGPLGWGTRQTSGNAKQMPPALVLMGTIRLSQEDAGAVDDGVFFGDDRRAPRDDLVGAFDDRARGLGREVRCLARV